MVATPILVLVMSGLLLGERITWLKIAGVILGALGALALIRMKRSPKREAAPGPSDGLRNIKANAPSAPRMTPAIFNQVILFAKQKTGHH